MAWNPWLAAVVALAACSPARSPAPPRAEPSGGRWSFVLGQLAAVIPAAPLPPARLAVGRLQTAGGPDDDRARAICALASGDLVVATTLGGQTAVARYAPDGSRRWSTAIRGKLHSYGLLLVAAPLDGVMVAGDGILARLGPGGAVRWQAQVEDVSGMAVDAAGHVVVTSHRVDACLGDRCPKDKLYAFTPEGVPAWQREMQAPGFPYDFADIAFLPDGRLVGVGYGTIAFLRDGNVERGLTFDRGSPSLMRVAVSAATGDIIAAGTLPHGVAALDGLTLTNEEERHHAFAIALSPEGKPRWGQLLPIEVASSLVVNERGEVFVAGSAMAPCPRAEVYELSARGQQQGQLRLPEGECQLALRNSATLPPDAALTTRDGKLFVTGSFTGTFSAGKATAQAERQDAFWLELRP